MRLAVPGSAAEKLAKSVETRIHTILSKKHLQTTTQIIRNILSHRATGKLAKSVETRIRNTASLPTKILDFRGFGLEQNLKLKGRNSYVHREFPGNL